MEESKKKQQEQMEALVRHFYEIPGKIIMLHDGEYLFHEGDTARYFYIVRSGHIFITKYAMSGRVLSLRLASRGGIIGELPLYEKKPVYIFNAVAQSAAEVYAIEFPVLQSYLEKKPSLAINLLKIMGGAYAQAAFKIPRPAALRQERGPVFHAYPPREQLRQGNRRRHPYFRAADKSGTCELFCDGPRKPQPHAQRAQEGRHH
jgi:hypothetical protein